MEREKRVTFNAEKINVMLIGKAKSNTEIDVQLKNGLVRELDEYKFLGNWLNKKEIWINRLKNFSKRQKE